MRHLDEITIQAFLDGEMPDADVMRVTSHLSVCDKCANALLAAEAETAELDLAFAPAVNAPVPTQRIWARIENEIDLFGAKPQTVKGETKTLWQQLAAFGSPSQIAFAGGLAAVVLVSLFGLSALQIAEPNDNDVAAVVSPIQISNPTLIDNSIPEPVSPRRDEVQPSFEKARAPRFVKADYAPTQPLKNQKSKIENQKSLDSPLAEEKDYLNSIAQLSKAVQTSDDFIMRPSFRVEYEKNLALMNQSIKAMQKQARQNPQDENAKRILFASYQNKIELLNNVAEKSQMIATLR